MNNNLSTNTITKAHTFLMQGNLYSAKSTLEQICSADPGNCDAWKMLSAICAQLGDNNAAVVCLRKVISLEPDLPEAYFNLGNVLTALAEPQEAINSFQHAIVLKPDFAEAYVHLGMLWHNQKRFAEAESNYRMALSLNPGDARTSFLLSSLTCTGMPKTAPHDYVAKLFDSYADSFDSALVEDLDYHTPELLYRAARGIVGDAKDGFDVLDLGCGTGLCGIYFRGMAHRLTGVDLSRKMIDKAALRKVYDDLHVMSIDDALRMPSVGYDLIVAADVFIYVGDLTAVFVACKAALKPGGLFIFSVEAAEENESVVLQPTVRYAHSVSYIRHLSRVNDLRELHFERVPLRKESGSYINGYLFVLAKLD